jgi:hypothetical protein
MQCEKCREKDKEIERLRAALLDAVQDIGDWASYADPYYHQKWGLEATLEKYRRIAAGGE